MSRKKILFFATEDWFVRSHFLPLLRRAAADGFEVVVAARDSGALKNELDVRLVGTRFARRAIYPWELSNQVAELDDLLAREQPDLIHAIALKPIALLLNSRHRSAARVLALTGWGYLAADGSMFRAIVRSHLQQMLRRSLTASNTLLLVENHDDARWVGASAEKYALMPGAGVDTEYFSASPEPDGDIVVGVIARLIRSKGIDLAVCALSGLREKGIAVSLKIGGATDPENPESYTDEEIERWRKVPGVEVVGRVSDVPAFWRGAHIACLPSRGGEGLPRSLLEAAASARPIVTTDTPGCADFARDVGLVTPCGDSEQLAHAIALLAGDARTRIELGARAREKVLGGYTEAHAAAAASEAWRRVLGSA